MGRLILLIIVLAVGYWLYKSSASELLKPESGDPSVTAPVGRARDAARKAEDRQAATDLLDRESSSREPGRVHENMTPSEVRALLGPPDEVTPGYSDSGAPRETWIYGSVGKKVIFENGVAVSVQ